MVIRPKAKFTRIITHPATQKEAYKKLRYRKYHGNIVWDFLMFSRRAASRHAARQRGPCAARRARAAATVRAARAARRASPRARARAARAVSTTLKLFCLFLDLDLISML